MGKSCGQHDFFSLGGQYYSLGQSSIDVAMVQSVLELFFCITL